MNRSLQFITRRFNFTPFMCIQKEKEITLRDQASGYYLSPEDVTRRLIKVIALHDDVKAPDQITLSSTWNQIGLNDMTYVEVMVEVEREFEIEFPDEDVERFRTVNDAVQFISRSYFTV